MTEGKALVLTVVACLVLSFALFTVLFSLRASDAVLGLAVILALVLGTSATSSIIVHYGPSDDERRNL
ncbi:MAG TPA: hypothetical protein VLL27_06510 [Solirubrobacterales bacterium]|nr:hypothetical protein [Solirubrobacterales bacterium]